MAYFGLLKKKEKLTFTYKLWIPIILIVAVSAYLFTNSIYSFLASHKPINSDIVVVEGWLPDYAMIESIEYFTDNKCKYIITTGGPLQKGRRLSKFRTNAELAKSVLISYGIDGDLIFSVPADSSNYNRTRKSAEKLKDWLATTDFRIKSFNIVSLGVHGRKTKYIYDDIFGNEYKIGIISIKENSYIPESWWGSSRGFKTVLFESFAYLHTIIFN